MSKLRNAPLLEVIFELRWSITNEQDLAGFQYLHGDIYAALKESYPHRKLLPPPSLPLALLKNTPVYRFSAEKDGYPLFQLGPGLLTLNTIDAHYYWEDYYNKCKQLTSSFFDVYQYSVEDKFRPFLTYFDFFRFDFRNNDLIAFINENLHLHLGQDFLEPSSKVSNLNIGLDYPTNLGTVGILLNCGKNTQGVDGLVLRTQVTGPEAHPSTDKLLSWLEEAHDFCSELFKKMTAGKLYESFK